MRLHLFTGRVNHVGTLARGLRGIRRQKCRSRVRDSSACAGDNGCRGPPSRSCRRDRTPPIRADLTPVDESGSPAVAGAAICPADHCSAHPHVGRSGRIRSDLVQPMQRIEANMKRLLVLLFAPALLLFSFFFATPAYAQGEHFTHGGTPTCTITPIVTATDTSQSVVCTGEMAGLGNVDLVLDLSVSGFALYQCQNKGGNIAPGQNKVLVGPSTSTTTIPADQIKNGNLTFTTNPAVLTAPTTVSAAVAGCPNNNWTGVNPVLTVTDISLTIEQPPGTVIFSCSVSDPNGLTGTVSLTCG